MLFTVVNAQTQINLATFAARVQATLSPAKVAERAGIPSLFDLLAYWKPCRDDTCDAPGDEHGCCPAKARSLLMLPEEIDALGPNFDFTLYNDDPKFDRAATLRTYAEFQVAVVWATEAAEDVAKAYIVSRHWLPHDWRWWDKTVQTLWLLARAAREKSQDATRPLSQRQAFETTMAKPFKEAARSLEAAKAAVVRLQMSGEMMGGGGARGRDAGRDG